MNLDLEVRAWTTEAECGYHPDPDLWHYESSLLQDERELAEWRAAEAISICNECPVKAECLAQGMEEGNMLIFSAIEGSIWGGLLLGDRLNIRTGRITHKSIKEKPFRRQVYKKLAIIEQ